MYIVICNRTRNHNYYTSKFLSFFNVQYNYYNVANAKKICFVIDVEIKFHPYHSMHDVNVIKCHRTADTHAHTRIGLHTQQPVAV